jgi:hypothetical protein
VDGGFGVEAIDGAEIRGRQLREQAVEELIATACDSMLVWKIGRIAFSYGPTSAVPTLIRRPSEDPVVWKNYQLGFIKEVQAEIQSVVSLERSDLDVFWLPCKLILDPAY